jgi:hypothetical protein
MALRKLLIVAVLTVLMSITGKAQQHNDCCGAGLIATAPIYLYNSAGASTHQTISAATLASATALTVPPLATIAEVCVETSGVRYWDDGTVPTATSGMPVVATSTTPFCYQIAGKIMTTVKFIAISGSPTMDVSYYYAN